MGPGALFADRADAGRKLARSLSTWTGKNVVVLGIPRGGVPVAAEVAEALHADLDVVVARKVSAPYSPELAIGAVTADGVTYLDGGGIVALGIPPEFVAAEVEKKQAQAQELEQALRRRRPAVPLNGRVVIVVDDGLATGATMRAALRAVRRRCPEALVAAVPVGAGSTIDELTGEADELVCLYTPSSFWAVGDQYDDFAIVTDADVAAILGRHATHAGVERGSPAGA